MTGISTATATSLLTTLLGGTTYIALTTTPVIPQMDGTNIPEPNPLEWTNYARVLIDGSWWTAPVESEIDVLTTTNIGVLVFPTITNTSAGVEITGWAILDSLTAGKLLFFGDIPTTLVGSGVTPRFEFQTLNISINLSSVTVAE